MEGLLWLAQKGARKGKKRGPDSFGDPASGRAPFSVRLLLFVSSFLRRSWAEVGGSPAKMAGFSHPHHQARPMSVLRRCRVMPFEVRYSDEAVEQLKAIRAHDRTAIMDQIEQ